MWRLENINKRGGGILLWRVEFSKIGKRDFRFIREMRVLAVHAVLDPMGANVLNPCSSEGSI